MAWWKLFGGQRGAGKEKKLDWVMSGTTKSGIDPAVSRL
jgi:hypothetical protein